jgi:hypothetical protein
MCELCFILLMTFVESLVISMSPTMATLSILEIGESWTIGE